jgi:hypothetical protein
MRTLITPTAFRALATVGKPVHQRAPLRSDREAEERRKPWARVIRHRSPRRAGRPDVAAGTPAATHPQFVSEGGRAA